MRIELALQLGWRVLHHDWPPFHYAELRHDGQGNLQLYRVGPGGARPLEIDPDLMTEAQGWSILELEPASCDG
jgi:hypothetical protein